MRSFGTAVQDINIIAQRLRDELIAETAPQAQVDDYVAHLTPDGHWPDVDYRDRSRTHWSPGQHPVRTAFLATSYRQSMLSSDEGDALERAILSALAFWVQVDPQSDNWWYNCIHTPKYIGHILLLMGDMVPKATWDRAMPIVRRSGLDRTGANLTWEAGNLLVLACATRDVALLRQAIEALTGEIRITREEGIQPDFSFHQHGPQLYMGNYGEVFSAENSRYAVLLAGTSFALEKEKIRAISGLIRDGQQWFIWGRQFDYHALGRQLDTPRATNRGSGFAAICQRMAIADPGHAQEYADFAARVTGAQGPGASGPRGNRHYWRSDTMVHRPGHFYASVRMHSTRTLATEAYVNRENLKGYHLADGVCFVMQRGDEYHDIQPAWDWRKLPGATCRDTDDPFPYGRALRRPGTTSFVGGVSDGRAGVAAMDYDRDGVQARKAWFYVPDGWIALGAGISDTTGDCAPVTTSINQCLLKSDVLFVREGQPEKLTGECITSDALTAVHHDGIGYYLLTPQRTVVRAAPQSGTWTSIEEQSPDDSVVTQDVFSLWIEHGCGPSGGTYAYRVVPGLAAGDLAAYTHALPLTVLANDARLQAIAGPRGLAQAVFHVAGSLTIDDALTIEVNAPCALMLRRGQGAVTLSIADPTQSLESPRSGIPGLQVQVSGHYAGLGCVYDPAKGITVVTVDLPTGSFAGQTVQVHLRAL